MLHDPEAGKRIVRESKVKEGRDARDVLSEWDQEHFFGGKTVQLRLPLRDPAEVKRHLMLIEDVVHSLITRLENRTTDRSDLLAVQGAIKALTHRLNAYKTGRR